MNDWKKQLVFVIGVFLIGFLIIMAIDILTEYSISKKHYELELKNWHFNTTNFYKE